MSEGGSSIIVDISGAFNRLQKLNAAIDTRALLEAIGQKILAWSDRQFQTEGAQGGHPWKRLSPNTIAGRRGGSSRILQDTGSLKNSISARVASNSVQIGTPSKIAAFHQFGTRPYLIRPKNRSVLRFMSARGPIFARIVHHPGLEARPFIPDERTARQLALDLVSFLMRQAAA